MVRVKVKRRMGFAFPVPIWVVDEFFEALADLAWVGEMALRRVPLPREEKARNHLRWVKAISPSGIVAGSHSIIKDLSKYKGLDVVDVEAGDVRVKISLK
ncbi:hypothetical protein DSOL_3927 [Desulfosporosinus metallidurans]|uniref:Uncharacterized protein n=2 Tax=Desulfosporosinus metallidurans TaxID=1888891 RepID=A0A1Q8QN15_9FIRM|nr:hypothetical protein DSOL_3927 [Desulfosporosinus metallidurans]